MFSGLTLFSALVLLQGPRGIAIDERLAADAGFRIGDTVTVAASADAPGETVVIRAITRRSADPSEVARSEYRIRMHLGQLQELTGYDDRVDRFAVSTHSRDPDSALAAINAAAFGFRAHRSRDIAIETSRTFQVVSRFHRAIGVITTTAGAVFLLCIMLLKVEERRREIAALRLLGLSRRSVLISTVTEASVVAFLGSLAGGALGIAISAVINSHYQRVYRTPLLFSVVTTEVLVFSIVLSIVLGVLAGLAVSLRLVRARPLELIGR